MEAEIADAVTHLWEICSAKAMKRLIFDYRPSATDKDISDFVGKTVLLNPNPIGVDFRKVRKNGYGNSRNAFERQPMRNTFCRKRLLGKKRT